tara:strand:+ start:689 stop:1048 length:360 start_codon:yes stop_codon:yes gene_type:complete
MIYIGTDIVPLQKIRIMIDDKDKRFLNKIFSDSEQSYCNLKKEPFIHYGGRFAAKESIKKALLSSNKIKRISLSSIQVINDNNGAPHVKLINSKFFYKNLKVSISHAGEYAIAMALVEL